MWQYFARVGNVYAFYPGVNILGTPIYCDCITYIFILYQGLMFQIQDFSPCRAMYIFCVLYIGRGRLHPYFPVGIICHDHVCSSYSQIRVLIGSESGHAHHLRGVHHACTSAKQRGDVAQWIERLTASAVMHASRVRAPLFPCGFFRETSLLNVTRRSR